MKLYFLNILVWLDQGVNVTLGFILNALSNPVYLFGHPDETLSSVLGKNSREGHCKVCRVICKFLHLFDPEHCDKSIEEDRGYTR